MNPQTVLTIGQEALTILLRVAAPVLFAVLVVGVLVSIFQAITQIQESTLSFLPKLIAAVLVLVIAGPWMLATLVDYVKRTFESIQTIVQ
ncbi:MAG: flagellar biosynthesis protein FliQ [Burkholderiales bacterium]|nr:flagellar biosynthesis protein FliQ [Burkholderiales bacterium]